MLYNHFHGSITGRRELLQERKAVKTQIHDIEQELQKDNPRYQDLMKLHTRVGQIKADLKKQDDDLTLPMFG